MVTSSIFSHPIFQPGLVPLEGQGALTRAPVKALSRQERLPLPELPLASDPEEERALAWKLARALRRRRAGWLGHLRSFLAVNGGLAAINLLSSIGAGSIYPWFLYVTASWGIGLVIHGLTYRGWLEDRRRDLDRAGAVLGQPLLLAGPPSPLPLGSGDGDPEAPELRPTLPAGLAADDGWPALVLSCRQAIDAAREGLARSLTPPDVAAELEGQLTISEETVQRIDEAASAIRSALLEVAPQGQGALEDELRALDERLEAIDDRRLADLVTANRRLLEARRDKLAALRDEEERLRATIDGIRLAAQNVRLDAL